MVQPGFPTHLRVEEISDTAESGRGSWKVLEEFIYDSDVAKARIVVPAGFVTDFASVPRVPVAFWLTGDTAHMAAVVHDYLYTTGIFPKNVADSVFYEAMRVTGIPFWRAYSMYLGVKYGGWPAWNGHRKSGS